MGLPIFCPSIFRIKHILFFPKFIFCIFLFDIVIFIFAFSPCFNPFSFSIIISFNSICDLFVSAINLVLPFPGKSNSQVFKILNSKIAFYSSSMNIVCEKLSGFLSNNSYLYSILLFFIPSSFFSLSPGFISLFLILIKL